MASGSTIRLNIAASLPTTVSVIGGASGVLCEVVAVLRVFSVEIDIAVAIIGLLIGIVIPVRTWRIYVKLDDSGIEVRNLLRGGIWRWDEIEIIGPSTVTFLPVYALQRPTIRVQTKNGVKTRIDAAASSAFGRQDQANEEITRAIVDAAITHDVKISPVIRYDLKM